MSLFPSTGWPATCGFRLLPADDVAEGPSHARLTPVAGADEVLGAAWRRARA